MDPRRLLGGRGESDAASFLRRRGFQIVARNFRCAAGEIDLIAMDGDTLVFVEVRSRSSASQATPESTIGPAKQRQLVRLAQIFQEQTACHKLPCRFDVVSVVRENGKEAQIEHFVDAFQPVAGRGPHQA
ncbi:MAG: YraN family protein [Phycisphaerales bacterium]|nr:YraN family protein [Phycisphaerales bacterium]